MNITFRITSIGKASTDKSDFISLRTRPKTSDPGTNSRQILQHQGRRYDFNTSFIINPWSPFLSKIFFGTNFISIWRMMGRLRDE